MIVEGKTGRFSMKGPFTRSRNVVNRFSACDRSEPAVKLKRGIKEIPWRVNERVPFTADRKREGEGRGRPVQRRRKRKKRKKRNERNEQPRSSNIIIFPQRALEQPVPPLPVL